MASAYRGAVDSTNLKPEQIAKLTAIITRNHRFLNRLQARMERLGFTPQDPLYQATARALDGTHAMSVQLHYLSVGHGVGKPEG